MSTYEEHHYKETSPGNTVKMLKGILDECGIEVEEHWIKESSINTHSLRLTIKGTDIGTNGKGVTKEYAQASAYAEFFERFQNSFICSFSQDKYTPFFIANDEKNITIEDIICEDNPFMDYYFKATPHNSPIKKRSHSKSHITA